MSEYKLYATNKSPLQALIKASQGQYTGMQEI